MSGGFTGRSLLGAVLAPVLAPAPMPALRIALRGGAPSVPA